MQYLIDGYYTVEDLQMYKLVALMADSEDLRIEPSSATAFAGPAHLIGDSAREYRERTGLTDERLANAIHLGWVTGGNMVPKDEMDSYIAKGQAEL